MNEKRLLILGGGAAVALYIVKQKGGLSAVLHPTTKPGVTSKTLPKLTNPGVASTNMATRGGTATTARVPSSSLGFPKVPGTVAGRPSTVGGVVQGGEGVLSSIFNYLAKRPATPTLPARQTVPTASSSAPKPSTSSGGSGSSGGSSGGGGGSSARPTANAGMGGSAGLAGQVYSNGYFDDNGNWNGYSGYYDENGQFVQLNPDGTLPGGNFGASGEVLATVPDLSSGASSGIDFTQFSGGAVDENGNWDPNADSAIEIVAGTWDDQGNWVPDDPSGYVPGTSGSFDNSGNWVPDGGSDGGGGVLDSYQTVPYDSAQIDPITFDQPDASGYANDQLASDGVTDGGVPGDSSGGGGDDGQNDFVDGTTWGDF